MVGCCVEIKVFASANVFDVRQEKYKVNQWPQCLYYRNQLKKASYYLRHLALGVSQMLALVHGQGTSTTTKTVALRSELAAVALFAK